MTESNGDKRQYQRYEVHYDAEIYDHSGNELLERVRLKNISGGGVCLLSRQPERYSLSQSIVISIALPPMERASARLKGVGKVVRIGERDADGTTPVGVLVIKPFLFDESANNDPAMTGDKP